MEAALSDPYISDLFSLDQFFQKNAPPRSSLPSPNSMRRSGIIFNHFVNKILE